MATRRTFLTGKNREERVGHKTNYGILCGLVSRGIPHVPKRPKGNKENEKLVLIFWLLDGRECERRTVLSRS